MKINAKRKELFRPIWLEPHRSLKMVKAKENEKSEIQPKTTKSILRPNLPKCVSIFTSQNQTQFPFRATQIHQKIRLIQTSQNKHSHQIANQRGEK